jgi:hypothetical protein
MTAQNIAASVRARLLNISRETDRPFQELLQYYAMERFPYRLSRAPHSRSFILKGALMLRVWNAPVSRPTKDVDLLGHVNNDVENLASIVREICQIEVEPDGLIFDQTTVSAMRIKEDADYQGVRLKLEGKLENARITMQLDVGFGDVVTPPAIEVEYPTLLDLPAPRLRAYPRESVVAEKFQAMVFLGTLNSRMKASTTSGCSHVSSTSTVVRLLQRSKRPFENRATTIDPEPVAFQPEFFESEVAIRRWDAFVRKGRFAEAPSTLAEVVELVAMFLEPVAKAAKRDESMIMTWLAGGPWK